MKEIITPQSRASFKDLYKARYVIQQFALRDIKVRYVNSYLGYLWAVFNPLFNALILAVVFGMLVRIQTPEYRANYTVVLLLGFLSWGLFNQAADQASNTLAGNMGLLKKVYFPRISLCIAAIATSGIDFCIALFVTIVVFLAFGLTGFELSIKILVLPVIVFGILLLGLSLGSLFAILKVKYQDFKHLVPILFQALFFASPVVYTQSLIPEDWLLIYHLNPMYGYIMTFRWIFIADAPSDFIWLFYSLGFSIILFFFSMRYFSKNERQIVDSE